MIYGVLHKESSNGVENHVLDQMGHGIPEASYHITKNFGVGHASQYEGECCFHAGGNNITVLFQGAIYNTDELSNGKDLKNPAALTSHLYEKLGVNFIASIRGKFSFALYDQGERRLLLGRDHVGIESLFFYEDDHRIVFASSPFPIVAHPDVPKALDQEALGQFLMYCYNPGMPSLFKNVEKVRPAHIMIHQGSDTRLNRYWSLSFNDPVSTDVSSISDTLLAQMRDAVDIRLDSNRSLGVFVSGGLDSSTVLALARGKEEGAIQTFSYRCKGKGFDESPYARIVAEHFGAEHQLVEYPSSEIAAIRHMVAHMDEPFCDVGINIATDILGKAATQRINYALTGDGGDELFGGHPVYQADRVARWIDAIPAFVKAPLFWAGSRLNDSEKKKDFRVKWKRFSESSHYPSSLLTHRWRIYYTPNQLLELAHPDSKESLTGEDPYKIILDFNDEAHGPTALDRSLHSDYQTVVGFYLRRMDLIRHYGIETRFPLLDHRLVEYAARIPASLKIRSGSDTKYILKEAIKNVVPHSIVYRKDKLGHSIPLKNWLRENDVARSFMFDLLSDETINKRKLFNANHVRKMIDDHLSWKQNNSHRLWALMVLELWLQKHFDR